MQKGLIKERNEHLVERINNYLNANSFDNIFFTKCTNDLSSPYTAILKWNGLASKKDQEIVVDIPNNAKILTKNCYGLSSEHIKMFKDLGVTEMEICGTDVDACCLAIAFNLFDNNIKPIILSDLCASSSGDDVVSNGALAIMRRQFGRDNIK